MDRSSAHTLARQFKSGEVSATSIIESTLKDIETFDPQIQAFLKVFATRSLKKAEELDHRKKRKEPLGKLAGVPIAVKDNIHLKGEITTCASKFLTNYRAPFDATVVRLLEQEDAIIIGKTNLDEFAMGSSGKHSAFFQTKNPWNLNCSPGGSSSGSAAAVSARFCPISLGSDTGGSIRQPASFSGILGFKPTYGRVSRYGVVAYGSSLDQIGPFATNIADIALAMEIMGRYCSHDATSLRLPVIDYTARMQKPIHQGKIGIPWNFLNDLPKETKDNFLSAIEVYKSLGMECVEIDLDILKYSIAIYYILATAEAATNLARFDGIRYGVRSSRATTLDEVYDFSRQEGFGSEVKNRILLGTFVLSSGYNEAYYKKAQHVRALIIQKLQEAFSKCHVIILPGSPTPAFALDAIQDPLQEYLQDLYTICANLAGIPAISIPSGFNHENKPFGIQIMGPQTKDDLVIQFAYAFEKVTDFHQKKPPLIKRGKS